jgi:hypothetical protein
LREGFSRYIIGKHIDESWPRVEAWGDVGDSDFGPRIRTIFLPGDVICTTRGPKLKVATVDFRGLGAHTNFVLRTRDPALLLQPYLEAIVRSDSFQRHLAKHFRGSVNLFVNWSDAALYEVDLPPIEEQEQVIRLLGAIRCSQRAYRDAATASRAMYESTVETSVSPYIAGSVPLETVAHRITNGFVGTAAKHYVADGVPYIRSLNVRRSGIDKSDMVFISAEFHDKCEKSKLRAGDLLTVQSGHVGETAVVPVECDGWNCHAVIITRLDRSRVEPGFIAAYLNSAVGRQQLRSYFVGSTIAHLNTSDLAKLHVPVPPLSTQQKLLRNLQLAASCADSVAQRSQECASLYTNALNAVVSGSRSSQHV